MEKISNSRSFPPPPTPVQPAARSSAQTDISLLAQPRVRGRAVPRRREGKRLVALGPHASPRTATAPDAARGRPGRPDWALGEAPPVGPPPPPRPGRPRAVLRPLPKYILAAPGSAAEPCPEPSTGPRGRGQPSRHGELAAARRRQGAVRGATGTLDSAGTGRGGTRAGNSWARGLGRAVGPDLRQRRARGAPQPEPLSQSPSAKRELERNMVRFVPGSHRRGGAGLEPPGAFVHCAGF